MIFPLTLYGGAALFWQGERLYNARIAKVVVAALARRGIQAAFRLPQSFVREISVQNIAERCIFELLHSDGAIMHLNGTESDSGTVVELVTAMYADIPVVQARSDFRAAGDDPALPFNLMLSKGMRVVLLNESALAIEELASRASSSPAQDAIALEIGLMEQSIEILGDRIAEALCQAFRRPPKLDSSALHGFLHTARRTYQGLDRLLTDQAIEAVVARRESVQRVFASAAGEAEGGLS